MDCPACGSIHTRTLNTRPHQENISVRLHECECGARFKSAQVLLSVYESGELPELRPVAYQRKAVIKEQKRTKPATRVVLPTEPATWMRGL